MSEIIEIHAETLPAVETQDPAVLSPAGTKRAGKGQRRPNGGHHGANMREKCRVAFLAGTPLAKLSIEHGIPYGTLARWSHLEKWEADRKGVAEIAENETQARLKVFVAAQIEEQIRRGIRIGASLQEQVGAMIATADPAGLAQLASALDAGTKIVRRELGLDKAAKGGNPSIGVFADNVFVGMGGE